MQDFYCEQVLNGKTPVQVVAETSGVLAFYHTKPSYPSHIVVIPKRHIPSLLAVQEEDSPLLTELLSVVRQVAEQTVKQYGACRVITNCGEYQDSKHLHWHVVFGPKR